MACGSAHSGKGAGKGKGGKKPSAGYHVMPDGRLMKNSAHQKGKKQGKG